MINKAILVGRLGKDPELRMSQSNKAFCNFTLATDSGWGDKKVTDWHDVVCFDRIAENCNRFLKKGSLVYVEGRIAYDKYDKDGQTRYRTRIIANSVQFLDTKSSGGNFSSGYDNAYGQQSGYGQSASGYGQQGGYGQSAPGYSQPAQPAQEAQPDFGSASFTDDDIPF